MPRASMGGVKLRQSPRRIHSYTIGMLGALFPLHIGEDHIDILLRRLIGRVYFQHQPVGLVARRAFWASDRMRIGFCEIPGIDFCLKLRREILAVGDGTIKYRHGNLRVKDTAVATNRSYGRSRA